MDVVTPYSRLLSSDEEDSWLSYNLLIVRTNPSTIEDNVNLEHERSPSRLATQRIGKTIPQGKVSTPPSPDVSWARCPYLEIYCEADITNFLNARIGPALLTSKYRHRNHDQLPVAVFLGVDSRA
jgi:hypothetical protein